ncbi:MAG TPA: ATP-binding protein [Verrucomicrobiae bacterium]|nr:ATP-binding protein [Verrucomicrobiae bacterium]
MTISRSQSGALHVKRASASRGWSIGSHFLALAACALALSMSVSALAPMVSHETLWTQSGLATAVFAIVLGVCLWCSSRLRRPVQDLGRAVSEVLKGRLDARVPSRGSARELLQLSEEFNRMMERLQQAEAELQNEKAKLEDRVARRTAELAAANQALESFADSVSHDLRAPVRLVSAFSELLERESSRLSGEGQKHLQSIRGETRRMNEMIDAMLEMSRLAGKPLVKAPVNLSAMAEDIAASLQQSSPQRQADLIIQPGLETSGDERLLRSVLQNLLGNAWKFTRHQPRAHIVFGAAERDGERVFFVRDNGAGFDMAGAAQLFTAFRRLHTSAEFEGVGMGLATVRRILERHGGKVWAEGQPGNGATFYFTLSNPSSTKTAPAP